MRKHLLSVLFLFFFILMETLGATTIRPEAMGPKLSAPDYHGFLMTGFRYGNLPAPYILKGEHPLQTEGIYGFSSFFDLYQDVSLTENLKLELLIRRPGNLYTQKEDGSLEENALVYYTLQWKANDELTIGIEGSNLAVLLPARKDY